jgi:prepilin-type N-terminal cleavage/methylation domain-containing protein
MRARAFTLIELLVVIAIIALLMAILMPSLQKAKKETKAVVCRSRLRQWGLVWAMYMDENNGKFPDYLGPNWMQNLVDYYRKNDKLLYCPMTSHGRDADYSAPPVQTPACRITALGSYLE